MRLWLLPRILGVLTTLAVPAASLAQPGPPANGLYQIQVQGYGRTLSVDLAGDQLLTSQPGGPERPDLFRLERQADGSYRIVVEATGRALHENGIGDRLVSTRYQPEDQWTRFFFDPLADGSYRIRVKADGRHWHENGYGDRLVSTRWQPDDEFTRFHLIRQTAEAAAAASPERAGSGVRPPAGANLGVAAPRLPDQPQAPPVALLRTFLVVNTSATEVDLYKNGDDPDRNYVGTLPADRLYVTEAMVSDVFLFAQDGEWLGYHEITQDGEEQLIELPAMKLVVANPSEQPPAETPSLSVSNSSAEPVQVYRHDPEGGDPIYLGEIAAADGALITEPAGTTIQFDQAGRWLRDHVMDATSGQALTVP